MTQLFVRNSFQIQNTDRLKEKKEISCKQRAKHNKSVMVTSYHIQRKERETLYNGGGIGKGSQIRSMGLTTNNYK